MLDIILSPHRKVWETFEKSGFEAYFVGGCVRDALLGKAARDIDLAVSANPEEIKGLFEDHFDTGTKFGNITVGCDGYYYDVTTYRMESEYTDYRRPGKLDFAKDIETDLRRRDFTVNAMAYSFSKGHMDLFGGITDLNRKIIRAVGKPEERFSEDALRMMRAMRFSCELGFEIESQTLKAIKKNARKIGFISKERIYSEFKKAVVSDYPEKMKTLRITGLGQAVNPAFKYLTYDGIPLKNDLILRLAHMMKNIGTAMALLRFLKAEKTTIQCVVAVLKGLESIRKNERYSICRLISEIGEANAKRVLILKGYDLSVFEGILKKGECTTMRDLAIDGTDLISQNIAHEGIELRMIMEGVLDRVHRDPGLNEYEKLIDIAEQVKKSL